MIDGMKGGAGAGGATLELPVPDYDELTVARVLPRLERLTLSQLRRLQDYERRHANRRPVLDAIERLLA
jgi:hypothetical protein